MAQLLQKPYMHAAKQVHYGMVSMDDQMTELNRLMAVSNALPGDQVVGGVLRFQVADGHAMYLVTKESPLTLQLLPFFDAYQVNAALIRGLRRADVAEMLARERRISSMFAKRMQAQPA